MFRCVMVGLDGGAGGRDAMALATRLAPDSALTLVHVYGDRTAGRRGDGDPGSPDAGRRARDLVHRSAGREPFAAAAITAHDPAPGRGLRRIAARRGADLLVLGSSHRAALGRVLLLANMLEDLDGLPCPVAVAPRGYAFAAGTPRDIGVADDGHTTSAPAVRLARRLATRDDAGFRLLRAKDPVTALGRTRGRPDLLVVGSAVDGSSGRVRCSELVSRLIRCCPCPLIVVPAPGAPRSARLESAPPARDRFAPRSRRSPRVPTPL